MTHRVLRIGITGPIGCGKSTVSNWLAEASHVTVIDADLVARDVLAPGTPEVEAVYARFGEDLRAADGVLDRAALGRMVFADAAALIELEAIVHPAVRPRILRAIADADVGGAGVVVIEAIKLMEGGLADLCDEVWLVTCTPEEQLERLIGRELELDDARARVAAQGSIRERLSGVATRIVDTSGAIEATHARVVSLLDEAFAGHGAARST